jgi:hypothetical protein
VFTTGSNSRYFTGQCSAGSTNSTNSISMSLKHTKELCTGARWSTECKASTCQGSDPSSGKQHYCIVCRSGAPAPAAGPLPQAPAQARTHHGAHQQTTTQCKKTTCHRSEGSDQNMLGKAAMLTRPRTCTSSSSTPSGSSTGPYTSSSASSCCSSGRSTTRQWPWQGG